MKIQVTQEDIRWGIPQDSHECAIAVALSRNGLSATVSVDRLTVYPPGRCFVSVPTTPGIRRFVRLFDDGLNPGPIAFDLDIDAYTVADLPEETT